MVKEMNILFCEHLKVGSLGTWSVHIYEVATDLSKLGYTVVLINADHNTNKAEVNANPQLSLWRRIKSSPIFIANTSATSVEKLHCELAME